MDGILTDTVRTGNKPETKENYESFGNMKDGFVCYDLSLIWSAINYIHLFLSSLYDWVEIIS